MVFAAHRYISELILVRKLLYLFKLLQCLVLICQRLHGLRSLYTMVDAQGELVPRGGGGAVVCEFMEQLVADRWQYLIDAQLVENNHTKWLMFGNAYTGARDTSCPVSSHVTMECDRAIRFLRWWLLCDGASGADRLL